MGEKNSEIHTVLVANRGEIAVRIIRTIEAMGLQAVAVYSQIDANALHVTSAGKSHCLGASPQSYMQIDAIINAAKVCGAQAIHPGYGFLSENAEFARACAAARIIFIGPSPEAIENMGDKGAAKNKMNACGVVCISGYEGKDQSDKTLAEQAEKIGYPVMVKAAHGGGGRGMRFVNAASDIVTALQQARSEAQSVFDSDLLILEKAVPNARHIEVQVVGDRHGSIVHLGERDCSLQRRHQKIIEEAPAALLSDKLRADILDAALKAARSVSYIGAGTVEFLLDGENNFYFLEMNTRLQVEHPVTELVTGIDLVEWQIRVSRGEPLPLTQDEVKITGHAIEARLCAEDPNNDFSPSIGLVKQWRVPDGIRVDSGVEAGQEISPFYDSLVAKIICHGATRTEAIDGLTDALVHTVFFGPKHNKNFLLELLEHDAHKAGKATTQMIGELLAQREIDTAPPSPQIMCLAAVLAYSHRRRQHLKGVSQVPDQLVNWSSSPLPPVNVTLWHDENPCKLTLTKIASPASFTAEYEGSAFDFDNVPADVNLQLIDVCTQGKNLTLTAWVCDGVDIHLCVEGSEYRFDLLTPLASKETLGDGFVVSPMHGVLAQINVETGTKVHANTSLAVLEAMKMRHEIVAGIDGVIKAVHQVNCAQVAAGELLFEIEKEIPPNATST